MKYVAAVQFRTQVIFLSFFLILFLCLFVCFSFEEKGKF